MLSRKQHKLSIGVVPSCPLGVEPAERLCELVRIKAYGEPIAIKQPY